MKSSEFIQTDEDVSPWFVNQEISATKQWKRKGQGQTASVWQHLEDPSTVVKVIGGGYSNITAGTRNAAIAFVHFCVDHGHESKHFPIIHGINVDDEDVVQVRIERLQDLPDQLNIGEVLEDVANAVRWAGGLNSKIIPYLVSLDKMLQRHAILKNNSAKDIAYAVALLETYAGHYSKLHNTEVTLDLHYENWMMRPDGTVVASDPWFR